MTPEQVKLVQSSFQKVVPIKEAAGKLFYARLFELDPGLRPLFPESLEEQIQKLMSTIAVAVGSLHKLGEIVPVVEALGQRHAGYGVVDSHYDTVGAALLWTLEQGLGKEFTPEVKAAWAETYGILAATMKEAAAKVAT